MTAAEDAIAGDEDGADGASPGAQFAGFGTSPDPSRAW
jgi:hypothetical protein